MQRFLVTLLVLFALFFYENNALNVDNYIAFIEERSRDENFLEEYTKWSSNLLSQPGYLYGSSHVKFPCRSNKNHNTVPTSVHALHPNNIQCVGAMGDSFMTGLGARSLTPIDLLFEDRGISWAIGGDYTYSQIPTIPNALRQYKTNINGYSTKGYLLNTREKYMPNNRLNVAKSGARSNDMSSQADMLIELLKAKGFDHCRSNWKMITIFVGATDLCHFCEESDGRSYTPEQYVTNIRLALDRLYNASIPRMLINLVLPPDIRGYQEYSNDMPVCQMLLKKICPCTALLTTEQAGTLDNYTSQYQELLRNLTVSGRYDTRDDFAVVIQPFMSKTQLPLKSNQTIDVSYLSPDCFHFSGKGHAQAAISLWNNMFEPVGSKRETWYINEPVKCPTEEYPYIFTWKNSLKTWNQPQSSQTDQRTPTGDGNDSIIVANTMDNATLAVVSNGTSKVNTTGDYQYVTRKGVIKSLLNKQTTNANPVANALDAYVSYDNKLQDLKNNTNNSQVLKNGKTDEPQAKSPMGKLKLITITGFSLIIVFLLIATIIRRRKRITLITADRDGQFNRLSEESEDDMDIYTRPTQSSAYSDDNKITTTHGRRVPLD